MKILALAASNSKTSINKQLVQAAITELKNGIQAEVEAEVIDLNDFEMPLYRPDRETDNGIPDEAKRFYQKIGESDALLISFPEHNGTYSAAYKNLFDWTSRIDMKVYQDKPALLLASSPGKGGAVNVLKTATDSAPYFGMDVRGSLSVPSFYDNFDIENGVITNTEIRDVLIQLLSQLK